MRLLLLAAILAAGTCLAPALRAQNISTNTVIAIADAYVRDGSSANSNFGTGTNNFARTNAIANGGLILSTYLKFNISSFSNVASAKLRLWARLNTAGPLGIGILSATGTNWGETTITFANRPTPGAGLASTTVSTTTYQWYELDLTSHIAAERAAGRGMATLVVHGTTANAQWVILNAREAAVGKPELVCIATNALPNVSLTSPPNGSVLYLPPMVTLAATASDPDGTISQVTFFANGVSVGTDTTAPYSVVWNPTVGGSYSLTAQAKDNRNAVKTSAAATVQTVGVDRDPGLSAYWKLDETSGTAAADSSGNGNTASIPNATWGAGRVGPRAQAFNGLISGAPGANEMSAANNAHQVFPPSGKPFSVSLWMKPGSLPANAYGLINGGQSPSDGWRLSVVKDGAGVVKFQFFSVSLFVELPVPNYTLGVWRQLVLTYNGYAVRLYYDGVPLGSASGPIAANTAPVIFGGGFPGQANFNGTIDDIKVYKRELSPLEWSLTGHWSFEEGTGASARDTSGYEDHAGLYVPTWVIGRVGTYAFQTGGPASISNPNLNVLPGTGEPFSFSFWFSPAGQPSGLQYLMHNDAAGSGWRLALQSPGPGTNDIWFWSTNNGGSLLAVGRGLFLPGQWYKLTVTYSGTQARIYVDNQLAGSGTGGIIGNTATIVLAGAPIGSSPLSGRYDELRTYRKELTPEEVGLNAHWRLDESLGQTTGDSSGQGNWAPLSTAGGWTQGQAGFGGLNPNSATMTVPNDNFRVLPPTGSPFSLSFWINPVQLPQGGYAGLLGSGSAANGWQLALSGDFAGNPFLRFWSTANSATLDFTSPAPALAVGVWSKIDVTFNGGVATAYVNGRTTGSDVGGIQGSTSALTIAGLAGMDNFNGAIDEIKIHGRELDPSEIGPVAKVLWQAVLNTASTNLVLPGQGALGKYLSFSLDGTVTPTNGTAQLTSSNVVLYTPIAGKRGPDAFTYTVTDGEFISTPTVVALSVVQPRYVSPTGGSNPPLDGSSPAKAFAATPAAALDALWATYKSYDAFLYAPGTYETTGWRYQARGTANHGCKHLGAGTNQTTIKLVNARGTWGEGVIFAPFVCYEQFAYADDFEVHDMTLDCNAANNPKYATGEPITIALTLSSGTPVLINRVRMVWDYSQLPVSSFYTLGHAQSFAIYVTNQGVGQLVYSTTSGAGNADDITLPSAVLAQEVAVVLLQRGPNVDFYAMSELEVYSGANNVALGQPIVCTREEGGPGELNWGIHYLPDRAVDGDPGTQFVSGTQGAVSAISITGSNLRLRNLRVIGFGTKGGKECFPVFTGAPCGAVRNFGNAVFENCVITQPATANRDGCTSFVLLAPKPSSLTNAVVRNCQVLDLTPYFTYSQGFSAAAVENCRTENVRLGVYFEPDPLNGPMGDYLIGPITLRSNQFINCSAGIVVDYHPNAKMESIAAVRNEIVLSSSSGCWGMVQYEAEGGTTITNMTVLNNIVRLAGWTTAAGNSGGYYLSDLRNATYGNNLAVLGTGNELLAGQATALLPSGYRRAVFNIRNLSGALVTFKYWDGSGYVPQSQWP